MNPGTILYTGKSKKNTDIQIRYPQLSDAEKMCEYINILSKEETFISFQGKEISLAEEKKYVEDLVKKIEENSAVTLLAFSNTQLIGVSDLHMKEDANAHEGVFGISITKDFRGEGIGTLLMELVLDEAVRTIERLKIITLGVFANNPLAIKMYEKFGFVETGRIPEGIFHRGQYVDHVYMFKKVDSETGQRPSENGSE